MIVHLVTGVELESDTGDSRVAPVWVRRDYCDVLVAAEFAELLQRRVDVVLGHCFESQFELDHAWFVGVGVGVAAAALCLCEKLIAWTREIFHRLSLPETKAAAAAGGKDKECRFC